MNKIVEQQQLACCLEKQVAILRCPKCKHLIGCCRNCRTIFTNLLDLSLQNIVDINSGLYCDGCHYHFQITVDWNQFLAERRDLIKANLEYLLHEKLEFRVEARQEKSDEDIKQAIGYKRWQFFDRQFNRESLLQWLANNYLYFVVIIIFVMLLKAVSLFLNQSYANGQ